MMRLEKVGTRVSRGPLAGCASRAAIAAVLIGASAMAGGAAAQTSGETTAADAPSGGTVSEIVVTAQFRAQNLQQTPLAITALNAATLAQRGATDIIDVAQAAPNVTMNLGGGGYGKSNQTYVRGIGQTDFNYAFEPRVAFYIDDVYYSTVFGSVFDLLDIDQVEILRGPQGVLFGRNSVGGAVRIFSKKPQGDGSGYLEVTAGDLNRFDVKGAIDLSLVPDKLFLRVTAGEEKQDGYVNRLNFACARPDVAGNLPMEGKPGRDGCKLDTLGSTNLYDVRAQLRWLVNDKIENNIEGDFSNDRGSAPPDVPIAMTFADNTPIPARAPGTPNGMALWLHTIGAPYYGLADPIAPGAGPPRLGSSAAAEALREALIPADGYSTYAIFGDPGYGTYRAGTRCNTQPGTPAVCPLAVMQNPPVSYVKSWGLSDVLTAELPAGMHLKAITAFRQYTGAFGSSVSAVPFPLQEIYNEVSHNQFTEEVQLTGNLFGGRVEWTTGGFYLNSTSRNSNRLITEGFSSYAAATQTESPSLLDQVGLNVAGLKNESAFANADVHVTDKLTVTGGLRYSHETKTFAQYRYFPYQQISADATYAAPTSSFSRVDPRVVASYQVTPDAMVYASYSTGFTAGGNNARPFKASDAELIFDPENVSAYEVGLKTEWFDHRLRVNAAAFLTNWDQIQLQLTGCSAGCPTTSPFYYGNGGDARIKGFEVEAEAHPTPDWLVTGSVGYTDFKYVRLNYFANPFRDPTTGAAYNPNSGQPMPANYIQDPTALTLNSPGVRSPDWKVNLSTQYNIHLGDLGVVTPHIDWTWQATTYFGPNRYDPLTTQKPYSLLNARITYVPRDSRWSAAVFVTNLTDKYYYVNMVDQTNSFGTAVGEPGAPREWGVTLRRSF